MPQDYSRHRTPPNTHKTPPADLAAITADGRHMKTTRTTLRAGPTPLETRTATHFADRKRNELRTAGEYRADPKPFTTDAKFSRPTLSATVFNSLNVQNALAALERLPTAGETFHFVTASTFRPWDLTPAIIRLMGRPALEAYFVTLSFNPKIARQLFGLIDAGQLNNVHVMASTLFRRREPHNWYPLAEGLEARRQHCTAAQVHCKIQALLFEDEEAYVMEGSANLRSCAAVEQFTLCRSRQVYDFHREWINSIERTTPKDKPPGKR